MNRRVFLIVLDSCGVGALPDWSQFDPEPGSTLPHVAASCGGLKLPALQALGLGNIAEIAGCPPVAAPQAAFGRAATRSRGKDTTTGHWEMMGIISETAMPTFPQGFPPALVAALEQAFGSPILGNKAASGTAIIEELGAEHLRTGYPIVYTSADSVLQIACHEDICPVERLYALCTVARSLCSGDYAVGRIIARPFVGEPGNFTRTPRRHDFSLLPPVNNYLEKLRAAGICTVGVGKISDIFAARGLDASYPVKGNAACSEQALTLMQTLESGFAFINLVDFDMLYGHRNDAQGYGRALEDLDALLPAMLAALTAEDLLIITADHGNDPTTASSDHNREYVPVLIYQKNKRGRDLGEVPTLAALGATAYAFLTGHTDGTEVPVLLNTEG